MSARNGAFGRAPRLVRETAFFGGKYLYFTNNSANYGTTQNRSTSGSFSRLTGRLMITCPMIISAILWDVRIADDYICRFVTVGTSTTSVFDVNTSVTVAAPGTVTITPTLGDFLLLPGVHYLQLAVHDGANIQWWDKNAAHQDYTYYYSLDVYYIASQYDYTIPMQFTARPAVYANMTGFSK